MRNVLLLALAFLLYPFVNGYAAYEFDSPQQASGQRAFSYSSAPAPGTGAKVDLSCYVDAGKAYSMWKTGWVMIDLRNANQYNVFNIPGSVNMSGYAVKVRGFLKTRKVLLIDEGFAFSRMASVCHDMKTAGFADVGIVFGGLSVWQRMGFPLTGRVPRGTQLAQAPASIIAGEKDAREKDGFNWYIIDVSSGNGHVHDVFPDSMTWDQGRVAVAESTRKKRLFSVLFVDNDGHGYGRIPALLRREPVYPVFFLSGGAGGYGKYLERRQAMRGHMLRVPVRKAFCGY